MTRGTKSFLMAIFAALFAWAAGTTMIGMAKIRHTTSTGVVDMTDASQITRALRDPSFTASVTWGDFTLHGTAWPFLFPVILAVSVFMVVLVVRAITKPKISGIDAGT